MRPPRPQREGEHRSSLPRRPYRRRRSWRVPSQADNRLRDSGASMIPYRDENETVRTPVVTLVIIAVNVVVWLVVQGAGTPTALARSVCNFGLIAGELTGQVAPG